MNFNLLSWLDKNRFSYYWDLSGNSSHEVFCYNIPFSCLLILVRSMWNIFWKWNGRKKDWNGNCVLNRSSTFLVSLFLISVNFFCCLNREFKITFLLDYCWVKEKPSYIYIHTHMYITVVLNLATLCNSLIPIVFFLK